MLYYNFKNSEGFSERFGIVTHGNGEQNRKNKILLAFIKNKDLLHEARMTGDYSLINISSMSELKNRVLVKIRESSIDNPYPVKLFGFTFWNNLYSFDGRYGICEDGDTKSVRYVNVKTNKVYKMKAGKFFRAIILESSFGRTLPEQVLGYLCEEFSHDWETFCVQSIPKHTLHVDDDFEKIYSSDCCEGDFHSCMTNKGLHYFYSDSVDASAAYLENDKGKVIARCVIYNKVFDEDGNVYRLAERQYSTDSSEILKRTLVDELIKENKIDGYKRVGAGCGDAREFVDIKRNSLFDKKFHISCNLDIDDCLSYQDSFKYYDIHHHIAHNRNLINADYELDTTSGSLREELENYDDYHDEWTDSDLVTVYVGGEEISCADDRLDDFVWSEREEMYIHKDDVHYCDRCGAPYLDGEYSAITGNCYCCLSCMERDEEEYKESNWYYSDYDEEWYEHIDDITTYMSYDGSGYFERTINVYTLNELIGDEEFTVIDDIAYDKVGDNGLPIGSEELELEEAY